ncbi:RimJ/RimL family protein N-acetyltransferase [Clostridium moniliforme]|uniref:RimJ/RimL family protein N-acetyltransferase n=1 Tax=Clostridium moniliforme TaxID=39489 RepID=A0ABS4F1F5_9CLOT|nr:GNAT family N-acetyltransferase [Clostridium moniliforme]MBP1890076.1 RimJ/RimL family protein N-acetyltransferase [Clostridium moniliforme]
MKRSNISLRQEVFRDDALMIIDWLNDFEITRYLNEDSQICTHIKNIIENSNNPVLTPIFNQNGSFFMIDKKEEPIGFLKLVPKRDKAEIVIAIGNKDEWGKGIGPNVVLQGLKTAFFDWRVNEVIAKVKYDNNRSRRVFEKIGFEMDKNLSNEVQYNLTMMDFFKQIA